ncbi:MAG: hypothetical protein ACT4OX_08790 [Actinomycetota bacterium]
MVADDVVKETESWFIGRGLPHFIEGYSATADIWTRALPALTLLFLVEIAVLAPNEEFAIWLDVVVIATAFGALLGAWALVNRHRSRRPLARPDSVGPIEIAAFILVPALVPLALGGQFRQAVVTASANVVLLGVIYLTTSYGLLAMTRWGLGRLVRQLEAIVSLLARALPMIALLVTFLFLTNEVWQTAGALHGIAYWLAAGLFFVVGVVFVIVRLPRDVSELNRFEDADDIVALCDGTPIATVTDTAAHPAAPPLGRREWGNVGLVALFSQGVQIIIVSVLIGVFFLVLGLLLVDEVTTADWARRVHVLATLTVGDRELVVTEELLRVAGFLTAFSGLNFTVFLLTDETYRREFRDEVVGELRQAFAVRAAYLAHRAGLSATVSPT